MTLFTNAQYRQLMKNGHPTNSGKDHKPVVKIVLPEAGTVFLLTEIDNEDPDSAFGLCDFNQNHIGLSYVSLYELEEAETRFGDRVEPDPNFEPRHPLSVYAKAARRFNTITTAEEDLQDQFSLPV